MVSKYLKVMLNNLKPGYDIMQQYTITIHCQIATTLPAIASFFSLEESTNMIYLYLPQILGASEIF